MNIPPTQATIDRVAELGKLIGNALAGSPFAVRHSDDIEGFPHNHTFQVAHDTLPDRFLVIMWGVPAHTDDCDCIEAPNPRLTIVVMDSDHEGGPLPESGAIKLDNPTVNEAVIATTLMSVAMFHTFGNI